jgi:dolichol-phosphate mannosyltransferase
MDDPQSSRPRISIVLPAHDESDVVGITLDRVRTVMEGAGLVGRYEVIVVSDGSRDDTFAAASGRLDAGMPGVVLELAKNVGSHAAIRAGLREGSGEAVAIMAADGQDPPEILPEMLAEIDQGLDVVWGARSRRRADPLLRRLLAGVFYRFFRVLTGLDYPPRGYDFVMVRHTVADALNQHRERNAPLFLLLYNIGFRQGEIEYERGERAGGTSSWTLRKRIRLAVDMVTAFSAAPIRTVSIAGALIGGFGLIYGGVTVVRALLGQTPVDGWASLMVVSSLLGGLTLLAIAFIGEYLWRVLDEARGRPLFVEARRHESGGMNRDG